MRLHLPERGERGAIAIMTAFLVVVIMAAAALAVDISTQVNQRQKLHDTTDAAALAGAYRLPSQGAQAKLDALAFAAKNDDPGAPPPVVDLYCVVASLSAGVPGLVDNSQIPATCNPLSVRAGSSPNYTWTGSRCNTKICSIPCSGAVGSLDRCNVIRVVGTKPVPFAFAPVIGINQGSTGSVTSVACKGSCGTTSPNPMDVAVVADRTSSMNSADMLAMRNGIKSMFQVMTPSQQYVALGAIGRSKLGAAQACLSQAWDDRYPAQKGPWMAVPFTTDYLSPGTTTLNPSSTLVTGVDCLASQSSTGTYLASPMKAAARYLLGLPTNNLPSPETRTGTIRKAIIFETDGAPNESTVAGSTALSTSGDIGSSNGATACNNFTTVATNAKNATPGIMVVTVAYNISPTDRCDGSGTPRIDQTLAKAASEKSPGVLSQADIDCSGTNQAASDRRAAENHDGDFFFCAASGTDMTEIFKTALGQLGGGTRLMKLP